MPTDLEIMQDQGFMTALLVPEMARWCAAVSRLIIAGGVDYSSATQQLSYAVGEPGEDGTLLVGTQEE